MTAKQRKLFLLTSVMSVFVMAVAVLFTGGKVSLRPFNVRSSGETVNETITWDKNSLKTSHSSYNKTYVATTTSGTAIYLYSRSYWPTSGDEIFDGKEATSGPYGIFVSAEEGNKDSLFAFQNITKVSVTTGTRTESGSGFKIYAHGLGENPDVEQSTLYPGSVHTYNFNITNGSSLVILPKNTTEIDINAVSITYSCSPGGAPTEKSLSSISVSGQKTGFTVGDTFSFEGTVTAHYSDSTEADVTSSATFTGYNMGVIGAQTVTVSYTEDEVNKTTTYSITVSELPSEDEIIGTYNYQTRGITENRKNWTGYMSLTFGNDGTCTWSANRPNATDGYDYQSKVFFTYDSEIVGSTLEFTLEVTGYELRRFRTTTGVEDTTSTKYASWFSGGGTDRPVPNAFNPGVKNTTGIVLSKTTKSTLTIKTYEYVSLTKVYEEYDTLTFALAS